MSEGEFKHRLREHCRKRERENRRGSAAYNRALLDFYELLEEAEREFPDLWPGMAEEELRKRMGAIAEWKWKWLDTRVEKNNEHGRNVLPRQS